MILLLCTVGIVFNFPATELKASDFFYLTYVQDYISNYKDNRLKENKATNTHNRTTEASYTGTTLKSFNLFILLVILSRVDNKQLPENMILQ